MVRAKKNLKVSNKEKIRNLYNQIPHLTQDTIWKKWQNHKKRHMHESQQVIIRLLGTDKIAWQT